MADPRLLYLAPLTKLAVEGESVAISVKIVTLWDSMTDEQRADIIAALREAGGTNG